MRNRWWSRLLARAFLARSVAGALALAYCLRSTRAHADEPRAPAAVDVRVVNGLGLSGDSGVTGVDFSLQATLRYRYFEAGALANLEGGIFGPNTNLYAAAAGLAYQAPEGIRVDLLALLGEHHYLDLDCGFFCDSHANATLPWAGARLDLSYAFARSRHAHFDWGMSVIYGGDLGKKRVQYVGTDVGLFGDGVSTGIVEVGGTMGAVELVFGGIFDLGR